jgi:hypothetical protein
MIAASASAVSCTIKIGSGGAKLVNQRAASVQRFIQQGFSAINFPQPVTGPRSFEINDLQAACTTGIGKITELPEGPHIAVGAMRAVDADVRSFKHEPRRSESNVDCRLPALTYSSVPFADQKYRQFESMACAICCRLHIRMTYYCLREKRQTNCLS